MSSATVLKDSPNGGTFSVTLEPLQEEALRDFAGTFGISLSHAARIILSEYLDRAGYPVEMVPYESD